MTGLNRARMAALALLCVFWVGAVAAGERAKSREETYDFSNGDFIAHGSDRKRAPEVDSTPFAISPTAGFMVGGRNANRDSGFFTTAEMIDRLSLVVGPGHDTWSGVDLMARLIGSGEIEKYPDIRTDAGLARYATDRGGLFVVQWESGPVRGAYWFELRVFDAISGKQVFKARNTVRNSVSFKRWDGISSNEYANPVFNAFIDWYRANGGGARA
jgi:hypothetical protein